MFNFPSFHFSIGLSLALSLSLTHSLSLHPNPLRYKNLERLAAEEFERDHVRVPRTRPDLSLTFEPSEAWPSSSRSSTPSSFASQEEQEQDLEPETETPVTPYTPSESGQILLALSFVNGFILKCLLEYLVF